MNLEILSRIEHLSKNEFKTTNLGKLMKESIDKAQ